jgi:hypothetical protein
VQTIIVAVILYLPASSFSPLTIAFSRPSNASVILRRPVPRDVYNTASNGSHVAFEATIGLDHFPDLTKLYAVEKRSAPTLPRALSQDEYQQLMRLLSLTITILGEYNISYVLAYGSLIGSYVMHDMLPWDDDIDVFIHNSSKAKVMEIFQNGSNYGIEGYHFHKSSGQIYKLFFNTSNHAGKYPWKWPFIDILSYVEIRNSIIPVERATKSRFMIPRSSFYPFHLRPFGPLWVKSPHDPVIFFRAKYRSFYCKSGFWDHKRETDRRTLQSPCNKLRQFYPFVKRQKRGGRTEETLSLNDAAKYTIVVDEPYHESKTMYGW